METPRLADLLWTRTLAPVADGASPPPGTRAIGLGEPMAPPAGIGVAGGDRQDSPDIESRLWERIWSHDGARFAPDGPKCSNGWDSNLTPISNQQFREKNVFAKYSGGLELTFVRTHGPAEKAGIHDADILVGLQGLPLVSLPALDSAMQAATKPGQPQGEAVPPVRCLACGQNDSHQHRHSRRRKCGRQRERGAGRHEPIETPFLR